MIKGYIEHSEFGSYSQFDTASGRLAVISEKEFQKLLPPHYDLGRHFGAAVQKVDYHNNSMYLGAICKTHTRFPRRIYFQITRRCNLLCDYCFIKSDSEQSHLPYEIICNFAEYFENQGLMEVRLTGGEPTLHPNFMQIVDAFRRRNIYVSVATNGLWSEEIMEYIPSQNNLWIIVSIDGSREIHNAYRRGSYDIVVKNIKQVKALNSSIRLRINTVLTKKNKDDLKSLARLTRDLEAESITLIPLRPQVRYPSVRQDMLNAEEFKDVIQKMVVYKEKYGIRFTTTIETEYKKEIMPDCVFQKKSSCAAGREGTNLDYNYNQKQMIVYGCSYCPATDINENPSLRKPFLAGEFDWHDVEQFGKIWNDDLNWTLFRDLSLKSKVCRSCSELGNRCTGSCPIQNIDYNTIDVSEDVKSQLMKQMKNTAEWYCYRNYMGND